MESIHCTKLRRALYSILNRVEYKGESFQIVRYGRPSAVLGPIAVVVTDPAVMLPPGATVGSIVPSLGTKLGADGAPAPWPAASAKENPPKKLGRNSRKTR
jgi:antitoxin (DNA-binding transcriptional repressor) of toxin-antitoxin stability system